MSDLLSTDYPLLQEFKAKCPGTYKHSIEVAGMCAVLAKELDLDVETLKIAATYHDVGKMFNPLFFSENQLLGENPHDDLDPRTSYNLITRHVSDSVLVLANYPEVDRKVLSIVGQHHGTTLVRYFFSKSGAENEDEWRYRGSTPDCVESAILLVCDHVEATSRSKLQAGKFDIGNVDTIIEDLERTGQLDTVRVGTVRLMKTVLKQELEGSVQNRVDYDKATDTKSPAKKG